MKLLALDIATKTGWRTETAYGTWDFKPRRSESEGMRVVRFKAQIREIIELERIEIVSYERPAGKHVSSVIVAAKMIGVLEDLCMEYGLEIAAFPSTEIKRFATGKGNAGKPDMIAAAKALGFEPEDDNAADAIHLYNLTKTQLRL